MSVRDVFTTNEALNVVAHISTERPLWSTGFPTFDRSFFGLGMQEGIPRGDHCVIGGASHVGKTILALHQAFRAAESGETAAIFSLEMDTLDLCQRMLQGHTQIPVRDWRPDRWSERHTDQLRKDVTATSRHLGMASVTVWGDEHFSGDLDQLDVLLGAMRQAVEYGCTWLAIDHAQLIEVPGCDDYEATKIVNKDVRRFAREHGVTTVLLSQLKRTAAEDMTRSPRMTDLLGGTSIESNADHVLLLDHSLKERDVMDPAQMRLWLIQAKNRRGPSGQSIPVLVNFATLAWREGSTDEEHLWPTRSDKR